MRRPRTLSVNSVGQLLFPLGLGTLKGLGSVRVREKRGEGRGGGGKKLNVFFGGINPKFNDFLKGMRGR